MLADHHRQTVIRVNHGQVLDVAALAYGDGFGVAANDGVEPDAGVGMQTDRAHDLRAVFNPGAGVYVGGVIVELVNGHVQCSCVFLQL